MKKIACLLRKLNKFVLVKIIYFNLYILLVKFKFKLVKLSKNINSY